MAGGLRELVASLSMSGRGDRAERFIRYRALIVFWWYLKRLRKGEEERGREREGEGKGDYRKMKVWHTLLLLSKQRSDHH